MVKDEALVSLRRVGNVWNIPFALGRLALIRGAQGEYGEANKLLQEGLALAGERGEALATAHLLNLQGHVLTAMGDYAAAERCHQRSLDLARGCSHLPEIAAALAGLGQTAYGAGRYKHAAGFCEEALCRFEEMGACYEIATVLQTLADIARALDDYPRARQHLEAAQRTAQRIRVAPLTRALQVSLAELATAEQDTVAVALEVAAPHRK